MQNRNKKQIMCTLISDISKSFFSFTWCLYTRLGMSVTTQGGSGRQCVTGPRRNISKFRFVLLNVYRFPETYDTISRKHLILSLYICPRHLFKLNQSCKAWQLYPVNAYLIHYYSWNCILLLHMSSYPYLVLALSFSLNILWLDMIKHCIVHHIDQEIFFY